MQQNRPMASELEADFVRKGAFLMRDGAARRAGAADCPNKKLCLSATDRPFLVGLLREISDRPDCFFVKCSVEPRDGMFLGRVFLMDQQALARLWAELKSHPKLLCSLQDDDFTLPFRPATPPGIRLERLTEHNFADYESLTACEGDGGCYCAFWHQKWACLDDWRRRQKEAPEQNRATVLERVRSGFHVGVLAYAPAGLAAWMSVGPLPELYWAWRRAAALGEEAARDTAGIVCITITPDLRRQHLQAALLEALVPYGRSAGWKTIEGYPFDEGALAAHGKQLLWAGHPAGYAAAGFERVDAHWLSSAGYERSIVRRQIGP